MTHAHLHINVKLVPHAPYKDIEIKIRKHKLFY